MSERHGSWTTSGVPMVQEAADVLWNLAAKIGVSDDGHAWAAVDMDFCNANQNCPEAVDRRLPRVTCRGSAEGGCAASERQSPAEGSKSSATTRACKPRKASSAEIRENGCSCRYPAGWGENRVEEQRCWGWCSPRGLFAAEVAGKRGKERGNVEPAKAMLLRASDARKRGRRASKAAPLRIK